jgi:phosphatidylserine/phosphatidylglycerophosphate/cardiolipin synthase-like enzyme
LIFPHQKVALIDNEIVTVGAANLDNHSLRINFEVMAVVVDRDFARLPICGAGTGCSGRQYG